MEVSGSSTLQVVVDEPDDGIKSRTLVLEPEDAVRTVTTVVTEAAALPELAQAK